MVGPNQRCPFLRRHEAGQLRQRIALGQGHAEEALARDADHDRERRQPLHQLVEARQQLPAMGGLQAQELAPAGVEHDLVGRDARRQGGVDPGGEPVGHVADQVDIVGRSVGGVRQRPVLGVHHDQDRPEVADHRGHVGVGAQGGDVVDDAGTQLDAACGGGGMVGVDRERRLVRQCPHHRLQPGQLLLAGDRAAAGCGRLAAQVEDMGAVGQQLPAMRHGGIGCQVLPAVAEGVGRHVDHAHQPGCGRPEKLDEPMLHGLPAVGPIRPIWDAAMWVVKLGGSLHDAPALRQRLAELATLPGPARIVVPGGGPFADAVRAPAAGPGAWTISPRIAWRSWPCSSSGWRCRRIEPRLALAETEAELRAATGRGLAALAAGRAGARPSRRAGTSPPTASPAGSRRGLAPATWS